MLISRAIPPGTTLSLFLGQRESLNLFSVEAHSHFRFFSSSPFVVVSARRAVVVVLPRDNLSRALARKVCRSDNAD